MINAIKLIRNPPPRFTKPSLPPTHLRFHRVINLATVSENSQNMDDNKEKEKETTGDIMSHSFGEGYASRSEEEGFGGTYGGQQSFKKNRDDDDNDNNKSNNRENHPEYDKSQGSEVKEKEKSRHQTHGNC